MLFRCLIGLQLLASISCAQDIINIAENTLKVPGLGEEVFYYGFSEGDQLIFNFEEVNGKELKEIEIIELPLTSRFMDYKSKSIVNKTLQITKTGIYKFRFANSAISGRVCKIKVDRIPGSNTTKDFNTSVYWRTIQDTSYTPTPKKFLVRSDTSAQEIYNGNTQISSTNALNGNSNFQIVDFQLPENTISWSFYIGTGREGKAEYERAQNEFATKAAGYLTTVPGGQLGALALYGISYFSKVQGEDNVKYTFLSDQNSMIAYRSGQQYYYYKAGDVINEWSKMQKPLVGKVYLALKNDNTVDVIQVTVKVTAVTVIQEWETRTVQVMKVENRQEPYLKN